MLQNLPISIVCILRNFNMIFISILLYFIHGVSSYSTGAPDTVCKTLMPGHGKDSQNPEESPYVLTVILESLNIFRIGAILKCLDREVAND